MDRARSSILMIAAGALALLSVVAVAGRRQWPAPDRGAAGVWQKLRKLPTTASAMHTTAHPDDEHGGMLAMLSRGLGARVSLLTLTRGESGDNAIGAELFDALGLIRTEELLVADRYYGVDEQYFTSVADYGFSKRLDEALEKWGREHVLRDMVRIIRTDCPMVVISRFQGNPRDGHGNHEAAGLLTRDAFRMAGDPKAFADQTSGGLRLWQPLKLYMGGVRENEDWNVRLDTGTYDPVLGESYQTLARLGLSFQRSQNSGRFVAQPGPSVSYYRRLEMAPGIEAPAREAVVLRRHRHDHSRALSRVWAHSSGGGGPRAGCARCEHQGGDCGVHAHRSIGDRPCAGDGTRSRDHGDTPGERTSRRQGRPGREETADR